MSEWLALGAAAAFLATSYAAFMRFRGVRPDRSFALAAKIAALDAMDRRHRVVTVDHVALALLYDGDAAAIVRAAGGDPARIRRGVDEHLRALPAGTAPVTNMDLDAALNGVLAAAGVLRRAPRARDILAEMARRSDSFVGALLPDATTLARVRVPARGRRKRSVVDCERASTSAYRDEPALFGDTRIRLFDDDKTKADHVRATLEKTLGLTAANARYVTWRVQETGSAAVGPWPRGEAEKLATAARDHARAQGFPLRVSIESA